MNPELLLTHFDRISNADEAIPCLRRFVLDLAVRGKLVEQDSNDEPVAALIEQNDQVRRAIANKDRRADAERQLLLAADSRWDIPSSWNWCALADLVLFIDYRGKTPTKTERGVRLITAKNVKKGFINLSPEEFLSEPDYHAWMTRGFPKEGDILFTTEAPMGNAAVIRIPEHFALAQRVICFHPYGAVNPNFLSLQLLAEPFQYVLKKMATGLTAKGIKAAKLMRLPIALPPLAEQHRIVSRVDELMELFGRLEGAQREEEQRRNKLTASTLYHLNNGTDPETTHSHIRFFLGHFSCLTARPEQIKQFRQAILSLAVHGKLVDQDPKELDATAIIRTVKKVRDRLIRDGRFKQMGPFAKTGDETRFDYPIPANWLFCFVDDFALKVTDGEHATPERSESGHYLLSARNVTNSGIDLSDVDFVPDAEYERIRKRCDPDKNDILISCSGSVGRVAVVDRDDTYTLVRSAALVKLDSSLINPTFIAYALRAKSAQEQIQIYSKSTAQANLFIGAIRKLRIAIPPLAEQNRIVARVDELMSLCDQLEAQLVSAKTVSGHLAQSVLHHALEA